MTIAGVPRMIAVLNGTLTAVLALGLQVPLIGIPLGLGGARRLLLAEQARPLLLRRAEAPHPPEALLGRLIVPGLLDRRGVRRRPSAIAAALLWSPLTGFPTWPALSRGRLASTVAVSVADRRRRLRSGPSA